MTFRKIFQKKHYAPLSTIGQGSVQLLKQTLSTKKPLKDQKIPKNTIFKPFKIFKTGISKEYLLLKIVQDLFLLQKISKISLPYRSLYCIVSCGPPDAGAVSLVIVGTLEKTILS